MSSKTRFYFVDQIRGFAVLLMIIFHFNYDLSLYGLSPINSMQRWFWWGLPRLIVFLFLLSVGISLCLAHKDKICWKKFNLRFAKIASGALIISISTYFLYPERWIYFGTLHCIAVTSLMALPFLKRPKLALTFAILILIPLFIFDFKYPWPSMAHKSMDYIPAIPWISVVFVGIFLHKIKLHEKIQLPEIYLFRSLKTLGKHSFAIYLIHQPILFSIAWLIHKIVR